MQCELGRWCRGFGTGRYWWAAPFAVGRNHLCYQTDLMLSVRVLQEQEGERAGETRGDLQSLRPVYCWLNYQLICLSVLLIAVHRTREFLGAKRTCMGAGLRGVLPCWCPACAARSVCYSCTEQPLPSEVSCMFGSTNSRIHFISQMFSGNFPWKEFPPLSWW